MRVRVRVCGQNGKGKKRERTANVDSDEVRNFCAQVTELLHARSNRVVFLRCAGRDFRLRDNKHSWWLEICDPNSQLWETTCTSKAALIGAVNKALTRYEKSQGQGGGDAFSDPEDEDDPRQRQNPIFRAKRKPAPAPAPAPAAAPAAGTSTDRVLRNRAPNQEIETMRADLYARIDQTLRSVREVRDRLVFACDALNETLTEARTRF